MTKASKKKRLILLDAHAILHRAYHALPDFASPSGEPTGALYGVVAMLLKIIDDFKPDYIVACFDLPEPTYRHAAFVDYKAKREKTDETLVAQINRSRDIFAVFAIPIYEQVGFEADDVLGTIALATKSDSDLEIIIASGDMDTMQCVDGERVRVYTLKKGINDTILYDEAAVKERYGFSPQLVPDYKGLRGDASDNIPGIVGIGEKTATTLITNFGSIEQIYKKLKKSEADFLAVGITPRIINLLKMGEEEAQFSKMLATIRTDVPLEFKLPAQSWRTEADLPAIVNLFSELGFRTLGERVKNLLAGDTVSVAAAADEMPAVSAELVKQAGLKLWLLESERTNASQTDITDYGRAFFGTTEFAKIDEKLTTALHEHPTLEHVYQTIELPLLPALTALNQAGIKLDVDYLQSLSVTMNQELTTLQANIYRLAGGEFNVNSPKQLGEVLFDRLGLKPKNQKKTAGGQRSTKESELEKLAAEHEIIPAILRYRELQKLVSTYVDALPQQVGEDGRVRTTFLQTGTTTGRLSSRDPNLQNIPTRTEESRAVRRAFVADAGCVLVAIDYSQIELRIAAMLAHDTQLIEIFARGEDVHTGVAVRVFGVTPEEVTSEMRRKAKVINFGILYGMGVNALRSNLGHETSREEAQSFLNAYFNTFTRLAEYLEATKEFAHTHGYTETMFGRRRHFPGIRSGAPFIRAQAERMAINAPIQGTAADVMRLATARVYEDIIKRQVTDTVLPVLQVHDELVFEIKATALKSEVPKLVDLMEGVLVGQATLGVPLTVKVSTGPNWADLTDYPL